MILVRHLRPLAAEGRCYGRSEVAVARPGPGEARRILRAAGRIERVVSSPLRRCRALARLLAAEAGAPLRLDPDWREIDFGRWEGVPWAAIPRAELDAWAADLAGARPHGGESVAMLRERVRRAIARLGGGRRGARTLVVTHAGPIRAALFLAGAGEGAWTRPVGFGEVVAVPRGGAVR